MELTPANLELITEPLVVLDATGTVVAANAAGAGLLGVPSQSFIRHPAVGFPALAAALESLHRSGCRLADLDASCPVSVLVAGDASGVSPRVVEVHRVAGGGSFAVALLFRPPAPPPPASGRSAKVSALRFPPSAFGVLPTPAPGSLSASASIQADSSAPAASVARVSPIPARKQRVLVTDDDAMVRTVIAALLRQQGFVVVEAHDGEEALARWSREPDGFDLVLLDLHMPRLGGVEVMERLRAMSPTVKVILLSGNLGETDAVFPVEGVRYQQKPFYNEELIEVVRQTLAD